MKKTLILLFALLPALICAQENSPPKFALVIGNGAYTNFSRLANPVNDAVDMTAILTELGFAVETVLDGSLNQMENAVMRLRSRLSTSSDAHGFFFYAGHGVQSYGENYMLPADSNIPGESFLRQRAVSVQTVLNELNGAGNFLNMVVLDACRDNPLSGFRGSGRGLAVVSNQPADSIIVFSTSAGSVADDGRGRNGLFTEHLLNNMRVPGTEVQEVFRRTGLDVARASNRKQIPAIYNQFFDVAFFNPPADMEAFMAAAARPAPAPRPETDRVRPEREPVEITPEKGNAAKLNFIGGSVGTAFTDPAVIVTVHGSYAPVRYMYIEAGFDFGFVSVFEDVETYWSMYPYANIGVFAPFRGRGGFFASAGAGYMFGNYTFSHGTDFGASNFAVNVTAGFNIFDMFNISYSLRTDFGSVSNKLSVGYTYRFK